MTALYDQGVAGLYLVHVLERGAAWHHGLHQLVVQALGAEARLHLRVGKQHLEFGAEYQGVVGMRPVQRFDTEAVAHQDQSVVAPVVEREGKLAAQMRQHVLESQTRVQVQHQLRVALGAKLHAARHQVGAQSLVVVEFAVVRQQEVAVG